jgi:DnaD/phage-associated family protein
MGIYNRALSKDESECFRKWSCDFGYSAEIISEAYNIAVKYADVGKSYHTYMDGVLTNWYNSGCRTVVECLAHTEAGRLERQKTQTKKTQKSKPEAPRYGEFDINEAFEKALERSYGRKDD